MAVDHVFISCELFEPHGASGVELLGGDAHFAAQSEFSAVGETGGGVHIYSGTVYSAGELCRVDRAPGYYGLAV